jgi:AraC-like DNA-binding protein
LKQNVLFSSEDLIIAESSGKAQFRYSGSRLTEEEEKAYAGILTAHMISSKSYLNPELSLPKLAEEVGISNHYLSQVINERFKLNFFDFINRYRVEAFKAKVKDPRFTNYSLLGIAFECGFNSKSAFNRVFKQNTGLTPSQYIKSVKGSSQDP